MFEFDKYDPTRRSGSGATAAKPLPEPLKAEKSAFLLWGEHCIECAAPACYRTCDLYLARPDTRCRRFEFGAYPNEAIRGSRGPGAEIVFRKWGKLEARGNAYMFDAGDVSRYESWGLGMSRLINGLGKLAGSIFRDQRWNYATFSLSERLNAMLRRRGLADHPDGFLFEAYNPSEAPVHLVVLMSIDRSQLPRELGPDTIPRPFMKRITMAPGHHRELIAYGAFRDIVESRLPFNISITPEGAAGARIVFQTLDLVKLSDTDRKSLAQERAVAAAPAKRAAGAKCVVFDLDNTLWEGVLLETDDVRLKSFVPDLLRKLDERGILLSIASKNAHDHAIAKLKALGIEEYFLFSKINWAPKSENIKQIAKDIDIGLDTFVFVDDNPFELSEVAHALPSVECLSVEELANLLEHKRLQGSTSAEARTRRKMYREAMVRTEIQETFGGDYTEFLRSCDMRLTIRPNGPSDLERVSELVQRTNQLNFSGRKYAREEVAAMLADPTIERYVLICEDKFGSYGTVGFCIVRRSGGTVRIEDFMLSCRVQGKLVESALFDHICRGGPMPTSRLEINFKKTERNLPAQQVLRKLGFNIDEASVARDVKPDTFAVDFITVLTR